MSSDDGWGTASRTQKGQFAKGRSGNPRGRPRTVERGYTRSQIRRDFLDLIETKIPTKVMGRPQTLPAIQVIIWRMIKSAADGDHKMMLEVMKLRSEYMSEHKDEHRDTVSRAEVFEKAILQDGGPMSSETVAMLNEARRKTRGS